MFLLLLRTARERKLWSWRGVIGHKGLAEGLDAVNGSSRGEFKRRMGALVQILMDIQSLSKSLGDSDFQPQRPGSASSSDRYELFHTTP